VTRRPQHGLLRRGFNGAHLVGAGREVLAQPCFDLLMASGGQLGRREGFNEVTNTGRKRLFRVARGLGTYSAFVASRIAAIASSRPSHANMGCGIEGSHTIMCIRPQKHLSSWRVMNHCEAGHVSHAGEGCGRKPTSMAPRIGLIYSRGSVEGTLGPSSFRVETNIHNGLWWSGPVDMWASRASGLSTCPWGGVELMRLRAA